ncbi:MAG: cysteine dioxygenase family protein [Chthoniobacterales bacterium]
MSNTATTFSQTISPALAELIAAVRTVVRSEPDPAHAGPAVAELLQPYLERPDFLTAEQMTPDECEYCRHILHVEPDGSFSIVALVWLPGQETAIHDHVSWCVVGVHRGEEGETSYRLEGGEQDPHLVVTSHTINPLGSVVALVPPGDIHHVKNSCAEVAVSLHVYGADVQALGSSILRRYEHEVRSAPAAVGQLV